MKTAFLQLTDHCLGIVLCGFASLFKRKKNRLPQNVKDILIIKMFGLGSIILMTPMVKLLRQCYPSARIHFLTFAQNKEIVEIYQVADEVYTVRKDSFFHLLIDGLWVLIKIRNKRMDVIFDAEFFSRITACFSFLTGAKYNVGFYNYGIYRGDLLDQHCYFSPYWHITENFLELARTVCYAEEKFAVSDPTYLPAQEEASLYKLKNLGVNFEHKIIVFNPNISELCPWIDRRWPRERFILFGKILLSKGYDLIVIGAPNERDIADTLAQGVGQPVLSLAGQISLLDLVILLKRSFLLVTNDSGPLHIAASVNTPTFSFFGTDTPVIYGYNSPLHTIFYKNLACSPCLSVFNFKRGKCDQEVKCIRNITLEEVITQFEKKEDFLNEVFKKKWKSAKVS
jgi:ADP-heptose:LPS heptosyltransferase